MWSWITILATTTWVFWPMSTPGFLVLLLQGDVLWKFYIEKLKLSCQFNKVHACVSRTYFYVVYWKDLIDWNIYINEQDKLNGYSRNIRYYVSICPNMVSIIIACCQTWCNNSIFHLWCYFWLTIICIKELIESRLFPDGFIFGTWQIQCRVYIVTGL